MEGIKRTKIERYGSTNNSNRIQEAMKEKYNGKTYFETDEAKQRIKETNINKYGNASSLHGNTEEAKKVQEKVKETWQEKYGTDHPVKSKEIQEKIKQTKLEKYGSSNYVNREKANQTYFERYGVYNPAQNQEVIKKLQNTKLRKYGSKTYTNSKKMKETMMKRYGVPYFFMVDTGNKISRINRKFSNLLNDNEIKNEFEFTIGTKSYDIHLLGSNILIEINPSYTHNSSARAFLFRNKPKDPLSFDYHYNKSKLAEENGYHCIHVFDWDDWSKIVNLINPNKEIIYARKCEVREVLENECRSFLNEFHLQGSCKGQTIRLGLYEDNNLVQIMTFGKPRYNKNCEYELLRLCSIKKVVGGSEKLFKYFIENYNPELIVSYCDKSKFTGEVYKKLGFKLKDEGSPRCHWFNLKTGRHITDNLLRQRGADQLIGTSYGKGTDNKEIMLNHGFVQVYDCGQATWIWQKFKGENNYER